MFTFLPYCFEQLKAELLVTIGLKHIGPSDCKLLSAEIYRLTQKCISETTFKRVFGFAYSRFKPSLFTLDTMAVCCGYNGWEDFCQKNDTKSADKKPAPATLENITDQAERITRFTLQILKNRSGVPYDQTIKRRFMKDHMEIFLQEQQTATAFISPSGYGKTLALCHWVDELMATKADDDVVLFFSSATLMASKDGKSLNDWLLALMGIYVHDELMALSDFETKSGGKFYLIIDGLDSHHYKNNQFDLVFNQLADIVSLYQNQSWLRVICTMRSATWYNNVHLLGDRKNEWFEGFMYGHYININVPALDLNEFNQLASLTGTPKADSFTLEQLNKLSHPLFFQFYYSNQHQLSVHGPDPLCIYQVTSSYICQNIFKGTYAIDKLVLLAGIINEMDFDNGVQAVDKMKVNKLLKTYHLAYQDMLSIGVLRELNESDDIRCNVMIDFPDNDVMEHCVARTLLYNNKHLFNKDLVDCLSFIFEEGRMKLSILKWCIYISVHQNTACDFEALNNCTLKDSERTELLAFMVSLFSKSAKASNLDSHSNWLQQIFDHFFSLELLQSKYEDVLETMLRFDLQPAQRLTIKTSLCIIAAMKLDLNKFETHLTALSLVPEEQLQKLPINAQSCLDTIYYYLKYGIIKKEAFQQLTHFYFEPNKAANAVVSSGANDVLYLLALQTLFISQRPNKILRFINTLETIYQPASASYRVIFSCIKAEANLMANNTRKAEILFDAIEMNSNYSGFIRTIYNALKVKVKLLDADYALLSDDIKYFNQLCDDNNLRLIRVNTIAWLLANRRLRNKEADQFNQLYYDFVKTIRTSGCSADSFLQKDMVRH